MEEEEAATCGGESFTASTKVLLASGATIPIAALKPGDKVLATNVKTGKTQAETVAAVLIHHDTSLYDLTIKAGHRTAVIHTTASHLFWDTTTRQWVKAANLHPGDHLRTPRSTTAIVAGGYTPSQSAGWMWDLTIPADHDFYIDTTVSAVLAHNCGDPPGLDATGKIHTAGDLPNYVPSNWTTEQLQQLESDLQQSIETRQQGLQDLGEEAAHMRRLQEEIRLLRQVQKRLSGT